MSEPQSDAPFTILEVNGYVYRMNRLTGETWRLETDKADKKKQVWVLVEVKS